jgi:hypothetical protein
MAEAPSRYEPGLHRAVEIVHRFHDYHVRAIEMLRKGDSWAMAEMQRIRVEECVAIIDRLSEELEVIIRGEPTCPE